MLQLIYNLKLVLNKRSLKRQKKKQNIESRHFDISTQL